MGHTWHDPRDQDPPLPRQLVLAVRLVLLSVSAAAATWFVWEVAVGGVRHVWHVVALVAWSVAVGLQSAWVLDGWDES